MYKRTVVVGNRYGAHARPCAAIVETAKMFECDIRVFSRGRSVNGRSVMELMSLAMTGGSEIGIVAEGLDEKAAVESIARLIESGFGES